MASAQRGFPDRPRSRRRAEKSRMALRSQRESRATVAPSRPFVGGQFEIYDRGWSRWSGSSHTTSRLRKKFD